MSESTALIPHNERIELWKLEQEDRRIAVAERQAEAARAANRSPVEVAFDLEQRAAKALASSPFLPANVGKDSNERIGAAWGVLRYADMLGVDPYVLAQQIYVVHGRLGFSSVFLISLVNARAGLKQPIDWRESGSGASLSVTAFATDSAGTVREVTMTMQQVGVWGWTSKSDPWKADPGLMLRYRTAAKLIRLYFAGAVMGMTMTAEELRDLAPDSAEVRMAPELSKPSISLPPNRAVASLPPPSLDDDVLGEPTPEQQAEILKRERAEAESGK